LAEAWDRLLEKEVAATGEMNQEGRRRVRLIMNNLFLFSDAVKRDPAVDAWLSGHADALGAIARHWFDVLRKSGPDVREILHDGYPTACVEQAAFAYVNAFTAHVNVGFFRGAELADPSQLLEGTGKYMRHVKIRPDHDLDAQALSQLIDTAYSDMKHRLRG
jgi:hypothetical protein